MAEQIKNRRMARRAGFVTYEATMAGVLLLIIAAMLLPIAERGSVRWLGWIGVGMVVLGILLVLHDVLVWGPFERQQRARRKEPPTEPKDEEES